MQPFQDYTRYQGLTDTVLDFEIPKSKSRVQVLVRPIHSARYILPKLNSSIRSILIPSRRLSWKSTFENRLWKSMVPGNGVFRNEFRALPNTIYKKFILKWFFNLDRPHFTSFYPLVTLLLTTWWSGTFSLHWLDPHSRCSHFTETPSIFCSYSVSKKTGNLPFTLYFYR